MGNTETALTDEATKEITDLLNSWRYYVSVDGNASFSATNDVTSLVTSILME